jgi:anhydro-N-acetylmuramic acid kinase
VCRLTTAIGQGFAAAAARLVADGAVDLVVSHGQTVYHWVSGGRTWGTLQLGEPSWIAEATGAPVLSDLRSADIAAGGAGAPLMGVFDELWLAAQAAASSRSVATLNLGGIANLQIVDAAGHLTAFDSGPGNVLIDAFLQAEAGEPFDRDGSIARAGRVDGDLLRALLAHPYFAAPIPKTTGRETFSLQVVRDALSGRRLPLADVVATLAELTVSSIIDAVQVLPEPPLTLIASGGGIRNSHLMQRLASRLAPRGTELVTSDERGIDPDFKESLMFAVLGFLSWHGVAVSLPGGDGVRSRIAGRLTPGPRHLVLPEQLAGVRSLHVEPAATAFAPSYPMERTDRHA